MAERRGFEYAGLNGFSAGVRLALFLRESHFTSAALGNIKNRRSPTSVMLLLLLRIIGAAHRLLLRMLLRRAEALNSLALAERNGTACLQRRASILKCFHYTTSSSVGNALLQRLSQLRSFRIDEKFARIIMTDVRHFIKA